MDESLRSALWRQFGAAIDMLEKAVTACPETLWTERIWPEPPPEWFPPQFGEFWYVAFHTLIWLDIYMTGLPEDKFSLPAPFPNGELDSAEILLERPYTREELLTYLASLRGRCHSTISALTKDTAARPVDYPWTGGERLDFAELLLYNLRHVQEHAAQLCLYLGQHGVPSSELEAVTRAESAPSME